MPVFFCRMIVALIQNDPLWEERDANLEALDLMLEAFHDDADLFVLPEMFNTGFSSNAAAVAETMDGVTAGWMRSVAQRRNAAVCGSLAIAEDGRFYNRFLFVKPDGTHCIYDKHHLHTHSGEHLVYSPGDERVTCRYRELNFNLLLCYDLRFPVWSRNRGEADVIIYSASWPQARSHAWKSLLVARAIENQCYVIGVNRTGTSPDGTGYTGDSVVIDPIGEVKASFPSSLPGIIAVTIEKGIVEKYRRSLPALDDADDFTINL